MIYFEGAESYLVPYAVRTFFNSLAFQAKLLGYEPDTDITVLLADFEDWGNAGVSVVPRSTMLVQVSPLSEPNQETGLPFTLSTCGADDEGSADGSRGRGTLDSTDSALAMPASATDSAVLCAFSRLASRPAPPVTSTTVTTMTAKTITITITIGRACPAEPHCRSAGTLTGLAPGRAGAHAPSISS